MMGSRQKRSRTTKAKVNISSSLSNVNFWNAYMEGKMAIYERQLVRENFSIYPTVLTLCKGLQILFEVWLLSLLHLI
ncbi:uncharacterized protein [Coffea arabica]|uniref:Uncharacterized protein n=1 Tax=Coffea arabica TaxID=13443 RepID=A0A6P6TFR2_COFAR|nr:uncharacterized protein LOC113700997 isoform X3 [Coffea arabica]XP_027077339.1 uncharacterized protein LOC113701066 isoform X3 [Coffea arabica]